MATTRKLKIFSWQGFRTFGGRRHASIEVMAAYTQAAVLRANNVTHKRQLFNFSETSAKALIEVAAAEPGVIFWCSDIDPYRPQWRKVK